MAVKEKQENVPEEFEWNVDTEVQLFYAMHGHKPVGVNKYFHMACILEKFRNSLNKDISSKVIWDHLDTMYDMQALDDTENLPFPNDVREFCLPEPEFAKMMKDKTSKQNSESDVQAKSEISIKKEVTKGSSKESVKKDINKDVKESGSKKDLKDNKDAFKDIKKEARDGPKDHKKIVSKDMKDMKRDSKDKEVKKDVKKEIKDLTKEVKKEFMENKDIKSAKSRGSIKEKETKEEKDDASIPSAIKTYRLKDISETRGDDSPKRGAKRSTRGSVKPDDTSSNKSSSPTAATPPPSKRRRT